jgi:L-fucose mutarotase/ribose pyranase (RbsD/FucU family)
MKAKLLSVLIVILLLSILFSGCTEEKIADDAATTAEEIKERFLQALKNVESYKYSANAIYEMTSIDESVNTTEQSMVITGEIDVLNKIAKQYMNITSEDLNQSLTVYLVDNVTYTGTQTNGNITWRIDMLTLGAFLGYSLLEQMSMFLENETLFDDGDIELRRLSDETFENKDCYILQMTLFQNQSSNTSNTYSTMEYNIRYWIAKDSSLLKKSYIKVTIDQTGSYLFGDYLSITTEMEILFYDYNIPINIELPHEAKNASAMPPGWDWDIPIQ